MASGIYQIENQISGKRYIGSATNLNNRWAMHLCALRHGQHYNQHLQRAFNKYGEGSFVFSILERIDDALRLIPCEQHLLDTLNPEYNIAPIAGSQLGYHHSLEARRKMGASHIGSHRGEATRRSMSEAAKGERNGFYGKQHSARTRARISEAQRGERHPNYGKHLSEETRRKISEARKGKPLSEETRRKMSKARMGKHPTDETRRKLSVAAYMRHARARREVLGA